MSIPEILPVYRKYVLYRREANIQGIWQTAVAKSLIVMAF